MQPYQAETSLRNNSSRPFLRRYRWGINCRTSSVPIAHLLLTQQKDFKGARPIISKNHFLYAKPLCATFIALDMILRTIYVICPRSFGLNTLPGILQQLTSLLKQPPDDARAVAYNQDLVGFFTAIEVFRILNAVRWGFNEYCILKNVDTYTYTLLLSLLIFAKKIQNYAADVAGPEKQQSEQF